MGEDGCESYLLYRAVPRCPPICYAPLGRRGPLWDLWSSAAQMTTKVPPGSAPALARGNSRGIEGLHLPSVSASGGPGRPGPLQLVSPGQGHSWESAGLQTSWSQEGRGWGWVRPGAPQRLLLSYQPTQEGAGHEGIPRSRANPGRRSHTHRPRLRG